jgi:hypothetical protein
MAVAIKGKTVSWGIPATVKTASDSLVTGIVEDVKIAIGGNTTDITDEDGDIVTRVEHGAKNTVTLQTRCTGTVTLPAKGAAVTFSAAVDGVALNTGRCFVESSEITYKGNESTMVSITIHHYPIMGADGA